MTHGVLLIHSAPRALTPHIEWAAGGVLGVPCPIRWEDQPAHRGTLRAEMGWRGPDDTGARLASALRGMGEIRFEITQEPTPSIDGGRWSYTPELGIHYAATDRAGNIMLSEDHVRGCLERAGTDPVAMRRELDVALGTPWDEELETYRYGAEGTPMRWLHRVS